MFIAYFNLERESLLVEEIFKLCYLRILTVKKVDFGKQGIMKLIFIISKIKMKKM